MRRSVRGEVIASTFDEPVEDHTRVAEAAMERAKRLLTPDEPDADMRKMMQRVGPAMKSGCIGRPEKVREQLTKYLDMGIELFLLKFVPTVEEVQAIRDEIIAPLRRTYGQQGARSKSAAAV